MSSVDMMVESRVVEQQTIEGKQTNGKTAYDQYGCNKQGQEES